MAEGLRVSSVRFRAASPEDVASGLLGWIRCNVSGLDVDGLVLRRTLAGDLRLAFPSRRDSRGQRHFILRPVTDAVRRDLEFKIIGALGLLEDSQQ